MANAERESKNVMGRGRFLRFLGGAGFAAVSGIPVIAHLEKFLGSEGQIDENLKAELEASGLVGFAHNAASEREIFDMFLKNKIQNVEIDVDYHQGYDSLYVAHDRKEVDFLIWKRPEERELEYVWTDVVIKESLNPHFDLKFSNKDGRAVSLFNDVLERIPPGFDVTLSSNDWPLLITFLKNPRPHRTLFTVQKSRQIPDIQFLTENIAKNLNPDRPIGVSLKEELATQEVVKQLSTTKLQVVVWTVNNPRRALELAGWGAWGITSDETNLLKALNHK